MAKASTMSVDDGQIIYQSINQLSNNKKTKTNRKNQDQSQQKCHSHPQQ